MAAPMQKFAMADDRRNEERKRELERKKQKLAEMREEKRRKEEERRRTMLSQGIDSGRLDASGASNIDVDQILADVGIAPSPRPTRRQLDADGSPQHDERAVSPYRSTHRGGSTATLTRSETVQVDLVPRSGVTYEKSAQTDIEGGGKEFHEGSLDLWEDDAMQGNRASQELDIDVFGDESPTTRLAALMPHIVPVKPRQDQEKKEEEKPRVPEYTDEQKEAIMMSDEFLTFFARAGRVLERALYEDKKNVFVDYTSTIDEKERRDLEDELELKERRVFCSERMNMRNVTSIDFQEKHPELVAVSYRESNSVTANNSELDGIVTVWNMEFPGDTPEFLFTSQSPVTCCKFAPFHPNLMLGGTYSGRICLWDNRMHKRTPAQRSPLSADAHTHPVFAMQIVGSHSAHSLVTVSTDGRMCAWNLENLTEPVENVKLELAKSLGVKSTQEATPTALAFRPNSFNHYIIGCEDGAMYAGQRHGTRPGLDQVGESDRFEGHSAFVTAVDYHRAANETFDSSHLLLSSSFDWTVKLWSDKHPSTPLHTFDIFTEYVMDLQWSPTHPSVFACVDSKTVQVWNIAADTEAPATVVDSDAPLTRCAWSPDGKNLLVGDNTGQLRMYDVPEALHSADEGEWRRLRETLQELQQQQDDAREVQKMMSDDEPRLDRIGTVTA